MTKKQKVIKVDELIIHANDVKIVHSQEEQKPDVVYDPWGFVIGESEKMKQTEPSEQSKQQREQTKPTSDTQISDREASDQEFIEESEGQEAQVTRWSWI